jgi:endonuclease/exonuclease/phosphatase family metal-dependent hydrolase
MFHSYHEGRPDIVDYILNSKADVVCLQEASGVNGEKLFSTLNEVYPYIETGQLSGYECALLSKFPILSSENIDFNTPSARCSSYEILAYGDTVKIFNCHLESYKLNDDDKQLYKQIIKQSVPIQKNPQVDDSLNIKEGVWWLEGKLAKANAARSLQADKLNSIIENTSNKYIIVCGDFNDSPISYVHKTLTKQLKDAYTESGNGPGWSYNRSGMFFRIDHILISESFISYNAKVDKYGQESDHYPIFCTLEMQ